MTPEEDFVLREYLESNKHLPPEMRDFHDAKDLFKTIGDRDTSPHEGIEDIVNWRQGMVYTIDHFLWYMAIHGYELRKVKGKIPRKDLAEALEEGREERTEAFRAYRQQIMEQPDDANRTTDGPEGTN